MHKLRIGVIMGGKSLEREVSLNSGRTICDHIDISRYTVIPLFQTEKNKLYILPSRFLHRGKISDFELRLPTEAQEIIWDDLFQLIDLMYIAQHGRFGEDGCLQGLLEVLKIPYVGSKIFASALGMNKNMAKEFLKNNNIAVPEGFFLSASESKQINHTELTRMCEQRGLKFPLIIKPEQEGSSFGVSVAKSFEELIAGIERASSIFSEKRQGVIVEEYIRGMEFSCIVITDYKTGKLKAFPPTEIIAESEYYNYDQKYMPGRATKITPARCSAEQTALIQNSCVQVMKALSMTNLSRIDGFLLHNNRIIITDPNSFAGMTPSSFTFMQAAQVGFSHAMMINHLIETELHALGMLNTIIEQEKTFMKAESKKRVGVLFGDAHAKKKLR